MQFFNPRLFVQKLAMEPTARVADIGCGRGHLIAELGHVVGDKGMLWAVDLDEEAISHARAHLAHHRHPHVRFVQADFFALDPAAYEMTGLDWLVFHNFVGMLQTPEQWNQLFAQAERLLAESGRMLVIDWTPDAPSLGPAMHNRSSVEEVEQQLGQAGWQVLSSPEAGSHHFARIAGRQS